ncbi:MAG: imidazolonepropionase [Candidatus Eisenbacteria bacterium]|nr:imidazolonepropionase [Candidatus Eisenbacteria bacterium]
MRNADMLVVNIGELATPRGGPKPLRGAAMRDLTLVRGAAVAVVGERVAAAGPEREVLAAFREGRRTVVLDARGALVTPGLVDPHTHAVFAGTREAEFAMRTEGRTYEEIAAAGGGIRSSVRALRAAGEEELVRAGRANLDRALDHGTTTIEIKSGYGLSLEAELKTLRVVRRLAGEHAVGVVPTFLGAHEFPDEWRDDRDGYVGTVCEEMIPAVARERLARCCDVFCEEGVFSVEQSRRVLEAGKRHGLAPKVHADELHASGGAELAAEVRALSADHLVRVTDRGVAALAAADVVAVLLPGTSLSLGATRFAPARALIEAGVPVALATDMNPGSSMTESMQIVMALASMALRMTPAEVLTAATVNAAAAVGLAGDVGTLEPGRLADAVVWEVDDHRAIPYHYGVNLARSVVRKGVVVRPRRGDAADGPGRRGAGPQGGSE